MGAPPRPVVEGEGSPGGDVRWIDTHCHLDLGDEHPADPTAERDPSAPGTDRWARVDHALAEARAAGVDRFVTVATDLASSHVSIEVAHRHPDVWATVGLHPHDAKLGTHGLDELLGADRVVAVGECGLDYHYEHSLREVQREAFATQIRWAHRHDLTLVVHTREAWDDTFAVLDAEGTPPRTIIHCFTGGPAEARACLDRGTYLSFSGIVTFRNAIDVQEAAKLCPLDRLLVETDSPFLAPVPHRGKPNRPAWVPAVGEAVAAQQGLDPAALASAVWANAARAFRFA